MKKALIIFGSTGDLMYKKLIPALNQLISKGHLDKTSKVYAVARRDCTLNAIFQAAKDHINEPIDWDALNALMEYVRVDINVKDDYLALKDKVHHDGYDNIAIYLAVPPNLFPTIAKGVSQCGLINKGEAHKRIVFEKPFGEDLDSAEKINTALSHYFDEKQIYRIDHYLGKEMIQNILVVRFANMLFQNAWNHRAISAITILAKEKTDVKTRGAYYDKIGALKDMLQSHMLQMAALITMNKPSSFASEALKNEKVFALKNMEFNPKSMLLGQYKGYKNTDNVNPHSKTETFAYVEATMKKGKLEGVPIHFITGKHLNEKRSEIIVYFKDDVSIETIFPNIEKGHNKLTIKVAPEEGVTFQLNVKKPGLSEAIVPATMDYCHVCQALENIPEAYEKLLLDLLHENRTLFTRWDEVETTWQLIEQIKTIKTSPIIYDSYEELLAKLKSKGVPTDDL
ncbi:MAG: glucose-6-phosphate dehydrogenase [Bacillota bacterium]